MSFLSKSRCGIAESTGRSFWRSSQRCLSTTRPRHGSPLFALGALSNARETQHLAKESRLSRVQHSPNLQLIESSEVAPYAPPRPPPVPLQQALERSRQKAPTNPPELKSVATSNPPIDGVNKVASPITGSVTTQPSTDGVSEAELISIGRAILVEKNEEISRLKEKLAEERERSERREATYALARTRSRDRISRLHSQLSSERLWKWTLLVIGACAATWVYASKNGKSPFSFGEAYVGKKTRQVEKKPVHSPPASLSSISPAATQPSPPLTAAPSPPVIAERSTTQPSRLGRLLWSS